MNLVIINNNNTIRTPIEVPVQVQFNDQEGIINYGDERYEVVMRTKPEKLLKAVYEISRSKPVNEYCKYGLGKIREKVPLKTLLITLNLTPEYIFEDGWRIVIREREAIVMELMKRYKNIQFALTTIEHHHTPSNKMLGKEKELDIPALEMSGNIVINTKKLKKNNDEEVNGGESEKEIKEGKSCLHKVYKSSTIEKFAENIKNWKIKEKIIKDMNDEEKNVTYYNFLQTLHYLNPEANRDQTFREWIIASQRYMMDRMPRMDGSKPSPPPEWSDDQKTIISYHKDCGNNLLGYPHIHIALAYSDETNPEKFRKEIYDFLMGKDIFPDPDVAVTKTKEAEIDGKAITYVLKNNANEYVYQRLREYGGGDIVKMYINNTENATKYLEFGDGLMHKGNKMYYHPVPMAIIVREQELRPVSFESKIATIDPEKSNYNRLVSHILEVMDDGNFVICEGKIYRKQPGTKMTYKPYMDIEQFVIYITAVEPYNIIGQKWNIELIKRMKCHNEEAMNDIKLGSAEGNYRIKFPTKKMDYRMIEFKDFFFNTITTKIYREQDKYFCHYYANISLEGLERKLLRFKETSEWLKILRNSKIDVIDVHASLFSLLRPQVFKEPIPELYGDSNAGKTTVLMPIINYYPKDKVSIFTETPSEYHIHEMMQNKELVIFEECNNMLNSVKSRSQILKILEGDTTVISNQKHGKISNVQIQQSMAAMTNLQENDTYIDDDAITNRLRPIGRMKTLQNIQNKKAIIQNEEPYIYLYTGLQFMRYGKEDPKNQDFFEIHDVLTSEDEQEIETIKQSYKGRECEFVDIYSDEYIALQTGTTIRSDDERRRVKNNESHALAVNNLINEIRSLKEGAIKQGVFKARKDHLEMRKQFERSIYTEGRMVVTGEIPETGQSVVQMTDVLKAEILPVQN